MFKSLRAIKVSAPIPRILLGGATALVLALALWLALILVAPTARVVLAAPNDVPIEGLTAVNDGPKLVNTPITFMAFITAGTISTYTWDFGDGSATSDAITPTHTYTASGIYTATVETENLSNTATASTTVYVGDALVNVDDFAFDPTSVTISEGGNVVWTRLGGDHSVTGDGGSPAFDQPHSSVWTSFVHTFESPGTFAYHCTQHPSMTANVVVGAPPEPIEGLTAANSSPTTVNTSITFSGAITAGNGISYTWDFGDGGASGPSSEITTTYSYTAPGVYTATVTAVNISSTATATTTAYVGDAVVEVKDNFYDPTPSLPIPPGGTVVWVYKGSNNHSVTADDNSFEQPQGSGWPPFLHTFTQTVASIAAADAINFTYHCTVHAGMTGTVVITTLPPPVAGLTADNDGPAQVLTPVGFTAEVTGGTEISYTWDFGDGGAGIGITTTHTYANSGIYTATVTAANATNTQTATTTVYVGDAVVEVKDNFYDPQSITVSVGSKVVWVLSGNSNPHSVTADDSSFEQPAGTDWSPFLQTFGSPGTVPYHCSVHGVSMSGTVVVTEEEIELFMPRLSKQP